MTSICDILAASRERVAAQSVLESLGHQALALSPTLSNLVRHLQELEQRDPITLAAVHRFVAEEVGAISYRQTWSDGTELRP